MALDPRLLRRARSARAALAAAVALGLVTATLLVVQAWLLAAIVAGAFAGRETRDWALAVLLAVVVARATVAWLSATVAARCAAGTKSELRAALLAREGGSAGGRATLATRGVDSLDGYFSLYLPQLVLAVVVPVGVLVVLAARDWVTAAIVVVTVPLIPVFMALVGAKTSERTDEQVRILQRLGGHFLDVVAGLSTLKVFGRAKAQTATIAAVSERYRDTALNTLRISFLSSLVLELLASFSMALVAVAVGLRLLGGGMGFETALLVLVLAPEAYLPLRRLGASYHAGAEGAAAAAQILDVLEAPQPARGTRTDVPDPAAHGLAVSGLRVAYQGRGAALDGLSLTVAPGEVLALTGPSGAGKSTLLHALLGLVTPADGSVRVGGVDVRELAPEAWHARLAWVPQHPHLFAGSIADNVRVGRPEASPEAVWRALADARLADVITRLPDGLETRLGDCGAGPLGRRAPARRAGPGVPARRAAAAARRAHRRPRRRDRGGDRARGPPARARSHGGARRTPPGPDRARRPRRRARAGGGRRMRALASRLALSTALGAGAACAAVGLTATSAWLISRAAEQPGASALGIAIAGVQFFALSRALLRYAERLTGHDAAFRALAQLRVHVYQRLEPLAPAGLPAFRRGDLLARFVHDVDSLQDLLLRVVPPFAIALVAGAATVALTWWLLPAAGLVLLVALTLAATAVPWLTGRLTRRAQDGQAAARGALTAAVVDLVDGADELRVLGALPQRLQATAALDAELARGTSAAARATGAGDGLVTLLTGLAMWGALVAGTTAVAAGRLDPVLLAVVVLVPLAAHELVAGLPGAAQDLVRARRGAERVRAVLDTRAPVREPAAPQTLPVSPALRVRGLRARYSDDGPWALDGIDLDLSRGRRVAVVGPSGAGKSTLAAVLLRFLDYQDGSVTLGDVPIEALDGDAHRTVVGLVAQDAHVFDTSVRENLLLARRDATSADVATALTRARLSDFSERLDIEAGPGGRGGSLAASAVGSRSPAPSSPAFR